REREARAGILPRLRHRCVPLFRPSPEDAPGDGGEDAGPRGAALSPPGRARDRPAAPTPARLHHRRPLPPPAAVPLSSPVLEPPEPAERAYLLRRERAGESGDLALDLLQSDRHPLGGGRPVGPLRLEHGVDEAAERGRHLGRDRLERGRLLEAFEDILAEALARGCGGRGGPPARPAPPRP